MRSYNRWLFDEHFELVLTVSDLYKKLPLPDLLDYLNEHHLKPVPPPKLATPLNEPPWSKYDIDLLVEDFRLLFYKLPAP